MRKRWIALCIALIGAASLVAFFLLFFGKSVDSNILDFHPSSFPARADAEFFYSVGGDLKFGDQITADSPTLTRGTIRNFLVAPDSKQIAVVANGALLIVNGENHSVTKVTDVDSIYKEPKPLGRQFFRDDDFQWTKDSRSLYLIKDQFYESKGSQLFSEKGELWRYDLDLKQLQLVLRPFPAYTYFLGLHSGVYFSVPTEQGDLHMRYFDGRATRDIGDVGAWTIPKGQLAFGFSESPFFSFSDIGFNELYARGFSLPSDGQHGPQRLVIGDRSYLALSEGEGFKGPFYCSDRRNSIFLPGDRFLLFSVPYCGNYAGQLLVDTKTGLYETLPKDSRIYLTFNTDQVATYRISSGGILTH